MWLIPCDLTVIPCDLTVIPCDLTVIPCDPPTIHHNLFLIKPKFSRIVLNLAYIGKPEMSDITGNEWDNGK